MNIVGISRTVEPTGIELSFMGTEPPLNWGQFAPYFLAASVNSDEKIADYLDEAEDVFHEIQLCGSDNYGMQLEHFGQR